MAHNRLQEHGRLRGSIAVAVIIGRVILIAAAAPRTPRGLATALTSADAIEIAQGISITPGTRLDARKRGPNWVALNDAETSAQMRVTVKPAGGVGFCDRASDHSERLGTRHGLSARLRRELEEDVLRM